MLWWNAQWRLDVDITNVTAAYCGISIAGPHSREILAGIYDIDLSPAAFPTWPCGPARRRHPGAPAAVGFVGELGYEIHAPASWARRCGTR